MPSPETPFSEIPGLKKQAPERTSGRLPGFTVSALLHCAGAAALLTIPSGSTPKTQETPHYSVQLIELNIPPYVPHKKKRAGGEGLASPARQSGLEASAS